MCIGDALAANEKLKRQTNRTFTESESLNYFAEDDMPLIGSCDHAYKLAHGWSQYKTYDFKSVSEALTW